MKTTKETAPRPHRHRWVEDTTTPSSGCGAEWFYVCRCGATKYVCDDQGETTVEIHEGGE